MKEKRYMNDKGEIMHPENSLHPWWYGLGKSIIPNISDITFRKDEEPMINTDITYKIDCEMEVKPMRNETYNDRINGKTIKHSIKDGMQVVLRNGDVYIIDTLIDGEMYLIGSNHPVRFSCFDDTMNGPNYPNRRAEDVMKIYSRPDMFPGDVSDLMREGYCRKLLWERDEARRMTKEEIEKALGYKINIKEV